jgi:hypothetical protein
VLPAELGRDQRASGGLDSESLIIDAFDRNPAHTVAIAGDFYLHTMLSPCPECGPMLKAFQDNHKMLNLHCRYSYDYALRREVEAYRASFNTLDVGQVRPCSLG